MGYFLTLWHWVLQPFERYKSPQYPLDMTSFIWCASRKNWGWLTEPFGRIPSWCLRFFRGSFLFSPDFSATQSWKWVWCFPRMVKLNPIALTPGHWPLVTRSKIRPGGFPSFRAAVAWQGIRYSGSPKIMLAHLSAEIILSTERSGLRLHLLVLNEMGGGRGYD